MDEAIRRLRRAVELLPSSAKAHVALGVALFRQGNNKEAAGVLQRAVALEPRNALARRNLGLLDGKERRYAVAAEHFRVGIEVEPNHQDWWYDLGDTLRLSGRAEEAHRAYQRAVALGPDTLVAQKARVMSGRFGKFMTLLGR